MGIVKLDDGDYSFSADGVTSRIASPENLAKEIQMRQAPVVVPTYRDVKNMHETARRIREDMSKMVYSAMTGCPPREDGETDAQYAARLDRYNKGCGCPDPRCVLHGRGRSA